MEYSKKVAIVTNTRGSSLGSFLRENLESVLSGYAVIENRFIDELDGASTLDADAILVMNKLKAKEVAPWVSDPGRLVVIQRTIKESEVYPICSIPSGTKVLVVNDTPETTQELAALLYKLEINNLQLIIFEDGVDYPDIRIAITPGESWRVPTSVSTVIDLGHRYIDIPTFVKLVGMLKISAGEISRRILKYSENLVDLDSGIKAQYRELYLTNVELETVVNMSHEGILLLDNADTITLCSKSLCGMLGLGDDVRGLPAEDVMPHGMVPMMAQEGVEDEVFEYKGRSFLINKRSIEHFGEKAGSYCNIQEVTYIRQLEQNLSRKLQQKGQLARYRFDDILTRSPEMRKCIDLAMEIAGSDLSVLITGESGTGKELLAQSIHSASGRAKQPFVAFNCAAVSDSLMESELFGYEGGSFTGALKEGKAGLFEQAHHGAVLLDEIG
ncbi:MAG: sigma 54-interacting transcriptional regulator, partial [Spirochaetaceae bacterium]|nr:sigma 54-interacting transcriptional regulator [Spirochaetaceae bacterium]